MLLIDLIATLAGEPFNLGMDQIKRLTLFQVVRVYFRERDDRGVIYKTRDPEGEMPRPARRAAEASVIRRTPVWFLRAKYDSQR